MRSLRFYAAALLAALLLLFLPTVAPGLDITSDIHVPAGEIRALGGGSNEQLAAILRQSKLGYATVLGLFGSITLGNRVQVLVGEENGHPVQVNALNLSDNTVLIIPAHVAESTPTGLIASVNWGSDNKGHVLLADTARIYVTNAAIGKRYPLFYPAMKIRDFYGGRLDLEKFFLSDSPLLVPQWDSTVVNPNALSFRPGFIDEIYPRTSAAMQVFILNALQKDIIGPAHVNDASGGVRLLSRAIDRRYLGNDADAVARTLQSVQDVAQAGGVASMAWNAHQLLPGAMTQRTSFRARPTYRTPARYFPPTDDTPDTSEATGLSAGDAMIVDPGRVSLWVQPLYRNWSYSGVEGMNINFAHDLNASLGGLALGVDYSLPYFLRAGIAAGMGSGHAANDGEYSATENRMTFHGVGAYVALEWDDWLLAGDFSYTAALHKLTQKLDCRLGMEELTADVRTQSHGYNVRVEHHSDFGWFTAVEHVGLGEMWLDTESYSAKSGGMTVIRGKPLQQQIGTFTAGLALERTFEFDDGASGDGWWLKPAVEYSVTYTYGDVQLLAPISLDGPGSVAMQAYSQTTVTDPVTHRLGFGLHGGNSTLQLGLAYDHTTSTHGRGHGLQAMVSWQF